MAQVTEFPKKPADDADERLAKITRVMQELLSMLPANERSNAARLLSASLQPVEVGPKQRSLPGAIVRFLPKGQEVTVEEIKKQVEEQGVEASEKQVFNAIGYLTRKGRITRLGYGRYMIGGISIVTADDLGGQRSNTEGEPDD